MAEIAFKFLDSSVNHRVSLQVGLLSEGCITLGAFMGSLFWRLGMKKFVFLEGSDGNTNLTAFITVEQRATIYEARVNK